MKTTKHFRQSITLSIIMLIALSTITGAIGFAESQEPTSISQTSTAAIQASCGQLLYFYSDNCPHCKLQSETIAELEKKRSCLKILRMNINEAQDEKDKYDIHAVPTIIYMNSNNCYKIKTGETNYERLVSWLDSDDGRICASSGSSGGDSSGIAPATGSGGSGGATIEPVSICDRECKANGYASGTCRTWAITPSAEWGCKADETSIGQTSDCKVEQGRVGIGKACCCTKSLSDIQIYISTNKYTYKSKENVQITARITTLNTQVNMDDFKVTAKIHNPDNTIESIGLYRKDSCICATCACEAGTECNCDSQCSCTYKGTYYNTEKTGGYIIAATAYSANGMTGKAKTKLQVTDTSDYPPKITYTTISPSTPTATKKFSVHMSAKDDVGLNSIAFYKVREPISRISSVYVKRVTSSGSAGSGHPEVTLTYADAPSTDAKEDETTGIVLVDEAPNSESTTREPTESEINRPELVQSELIAYKYAHNCNSDTQCKHIWTVTETQPGRHTYKFVAYDTSGQKVVQYKTFYVQPVHAKYVSLNEKFALYLGETAHVTDYNNMKLRLINIIHPRCATTESEDSTTTTSARCISAEPTATIEIINPHTDDTQTSTATLLSMSAGETREVFGAKITLPELDSKKGTFIIRKGAQSDLVDIKIAPKTRTISYDESAEYKITVTDKHPQLLIHAGCDENQDDCPSASAQPYTYDIIIGNLPFQKEYPATITLGAGAEKTFTLKVTPFQTTTTKKEMHISKAVAASNAITAHATIHPMEIKPIAVQFRPRKEYKFSLTAKLKNNAQVQDTDHATLTIKPDIPPPSFPPEVTTIKLYKGWNLISLPGKLIEFVELKGADNKKLLGFVYLPKEKKYVTIKEARKILGSEFYEYLAKHAFWIYSYDDSELRVKINRDVSYNELELYNGWNLLPVTEDMVGGYLKDIKGTCEFEKLYRWFAEGQKWKQIAEEYVFQQSELNYGIAIKSANYCMLGGGSITPPAMPDEQGGVAK